MNEGFSREPAPGAAVPGTCMSPAGPAPGLSPGSRGGGPPQGIPPGTPPPPGRLWVPWSAGDAFAVIGLSFVAILGAFAAAGALIAVLAAIIPGLSSDALEGSLLVTSGGFFLQWMITLGVAFTYLKLRGYPLDLETLGFRRPASLPESAALVLGLLVSFYLFLAVYDTLMNTFLPDLVPVPQEVREWYGFDVLGFIFAVSQVAIITPLMEEAFFRGIVHQGLEKRLGFLPGAVISSLIFALAHGDYTLYIPIFFLGFIFAFLTHRTRSLWPSVPVHFLVNSMAVLGQFLSG